MTTTTCLWFAPDDADKAIDLYCKVIPNTRVAFQRRFENPAGEEYSATVTRLEINGQPFQVMAASNEEKPTHALSMWLPLADQAEIDQVWDGFLAAGGKEEQCGWITDPFGVQWQVVPASWERIAEGDDADAAQRAVEAIWQMVRIDVDAMEKAARG